MKRGCNDARAASGSVCMRHRRFHNRLGKICTLFCHLHAFLSFADFFGNYFRNTIRVSNCLDPDQARNSVAPDMGPNCLQRLQADETRR